MRKKIIAVVLTVLIAQYVYASDPTFYNSTPMPEKFRQDAASLPADFFSDYLWEQGERYFYVDRMFQTLFFQKRRAKNVLTDGSVQDSPFFTNRIGVQPIADEAIAKGNISNGGPDMNGQWTILKAKQDGVSAGFFIKDARGDKYLVKLDLVSYPEMNSGAEVISSRLFYALGYNVPEYTIIRFPLSKLEIKDGLMWYDKTGFKVPFDQEALKELVRNSFIDRNGMYRACASKFIDGKIIGTMSLRSHRRNDPRDQIPHEDRRELRGLKVFCSWLNHFDLRTGNTLDTVIEDEKGWYVKHYLLDFGMTLGAHILGPKPPETGHEYVFSIDEFLKSLVSLGFYPRPWRRLEPVRPQTGYYTNLDFDPAQWSTHIPNYAFQNMDKEDALWAAKILAEVTDENIRAAVAAGEITNEQAREDLIKKLIVRRDMITTYWSSRKR
jgi:hypothetical protein